MGNFLNNLKLYEEGVTDGIEQGQQILLLKLLNKRLGPISEKYIDLIETLENKTIVDITLKIFEISKIEELDKYFA